MDSCRHVRLSTSPNDVLIVVAGALAVEEKKRRKLPKSEPIWAIASQSAEICEL